MTPARHGEQSTPANPYRGEVELRLSGTAYRLRPTFAALVAAEAEVGPLFALVDRAADGRLGLTELSALLWHCVADRPADLRRESFNEALAEAGLVAALPALRVLLAQILQGR